MLIGASAVFWISTQSPKAPFSSGRALALSDMISVSTRPRASDAPPWAFRATTMGSLGRKTIRPVRMTSITASTASLLLSFFFTFWLFLPPERIRFKAPFRRFSAVPQGTAASSL